MLQASETSAYNTGLISQWSHPGEVELDYKLMHCL